MISVSLGIFFAYTDPVYKDVKELRVQVSSYDEALDNSKKLEEAKNALNEQCIYRRGAYKTSKIAS